MDRRGALEVGGLAVLSGAATAGLLQTGTGSVRPVLVLGIVIAAGLAAAANYRARTAHADGPAGNGDGGSEDVALVAGTPGDDGVRVETRDGTTADGPGDGSTGDGSAESAVARD